MLRFFSPRTLLPEARLPQPLCRLDRKLSRWEFLEPFRAWFTEKAGRPTVPMEIFLRLMFLRYHYGWSYERLVAAVAETDYLRRFCRISIGDEVPHSTTVMRLARRCGDAVFTELFRRAAGPQWTPSLQGGHRCSA